MDTAGRAHATPSPTDTSTAAGSTCPRTCPRTGHPEREAATADAAAADGPRVSFGDVDAPLQVSLHELDNTHYPPSSHEQRAARTAQRAAEQKRATRRWENEQQKRRSPAPAEAPRITLDDIERYAVEASNIGIARYLNTKNLARLDRTERSEKLDTFVRKAVSDYIAKYVADASSLGTAQVAAHIDAGIDRAIVDSGASSHFVTKKTKLENTRPAAGRRVAVASGDVEPVAEIGDKGVLKNMLKVNSFTRSLISVSALSKLVGMVCFDGDKAGTRAAFRATERALPLLGDADGDDAPHEDAREVGVRAPEALAVEAVGARGPEQRPPNAARGLDDDGHRLARERAR